MIQFRCTRKVLDYLKISQNELCEYKETDAILGNWYINMFNIERRKTLLFMSEKTFLSFIMYGIKKEHIDRLPEIFLKGLHQAFVYEGIEDKKIDFLLNQCMEIEITKTYSRSLLGNLNDLMDMYKYSVYYHGGLKNCNLTEIIKNVNRTPQRNLEWANSIEATKDILKDI